MPKSIKLLVRYGKSSLVTMEMKNPHLIQRQIADIVETKAHGDPIHRRMKQFAMLLTACACLGNKAILKQFVYQKKVKQLLLKLMILSNVTSSFK